MFEWSTLSDKVATHRKWDTAAWHWDRN